MKLETEESEEKQAKLSLESLNKKKKTNLIKLTYPLADSTEQQIPETCARLFLN
jgi:hypothetical protein